MTCLALDLPIFFACQVAINENVVAFQISVNDRICTRVQVIQSCIQNQMPGGRQDANQYEQQKNLGTVSFQDLTAPILDDLLLQWCVDSLDVLQKRTTSDALSDETNLIEAHRN